jgi:hypothetical protein
VPVSSGLMRGYKDRKPDGNDRSEDAMNIQRVGRNSEAYSANSMCVGRAIRFAVARTSHSEQPRPIGLDTRAASG